jgi:hypothetical protein
VVVLVLMLLLLRRWRGGSLDCKAEVWHLTWMAHVVGVDEEGGVEERGVMCEGVCGRKGSEGEVA